MSHPCPICGTPLPLVPRYPSYVCEECASKAAAADGRLLQFSNVGFSGGFEAHFADTGEAYESHACWINGIPCTADEARFGGIVVEVTR